MENVLGITVKAQSYEEMESKVGVRLAKFLSLESRASNAKARRELGWVIEAKKEIVEESESGSKVQLAEDLRK
jgi:uncharacterized protein with beta-barrel porin domain